MTAATMPMQQTGVAVSASARTTRYDWRATSAALLGGTALVAGSLLPWMTFYAGLQPIAGTRGAYGKALLIAGIVVCIVVCIVAAVRSRTDSHSVRVTWMRALLAVVGSTAVLGGALLFWRAWQLTHSEGALMLVPRMGLGLPVVMVGGVLLVVSSLLDRRR